MTICFAWSNHVWWLLSASPLINYKCFSLLHWVSTGGMQMYLSFLIQGSRWKWPMDAPFINTVILQTVGQTLQYHFNQCDCAAHLLVTANQGMHAAKDYPLLWKWSLVSCKKPSVKTCVTFSKMVAFTNSLDNQVHSLNSSYYKYAHICKNLSLFKFLTVTSRPSALSWCYLINQEVLSGAK